MNIMPLFWKYTAIAEFVVIVLLLLKICCKKNQERSALKRKLRQGNNVNYDALIENSFKAKPMHDELLRHCHPDRFTDPLKKEVAEDLCHRISVCKNNYGELLKIKQEAIEKLQINP